MEKKERLELVKKTLKDNIEQEDNRQQCYKTGLKCPYNCPGLCRESC